MNLVGWSHICGQVNRKQLIFWIQDLCILRCLTQSNPVCLVFTTIESICLPPAVATAVLNLRWVGLQREVKRPRTWQYNEYIVLLLELCTNCILKKLFFTEMLVSSVEVESGNYYYSLWYDSSWKLLFLYNR